MELFNIDGTIKSSFAIGTGTNQIEFRSFDGKFFYRNYGESWKEVAGAGGKIRPWQVTSQFEQGEIVSFNGVLYAVLESHQSGSIFDADANKFGRIGVFDQLTVFDTTVDAELRLSASSSNVVFAKGTSATIKNIYLPDTTTLQPGIKFEIQNDSNITIPILYNDGTSFGEVKTDSIVFVTAIQTDTQNGNWAIFDFSVETGLKTTTVKFTNYNANSNELVLCNSSNGSFTVTLPLSPTNGDIVGVVDLNGSFRDKPVTLARNGKRIQDVAENWLIDISSTYIELVYVSAKNSWYFKEVPAGSGGSTPYDIYNNIAPVEPPTIQSFTVSGGVLREVGDDITNTNTVDFTVICEAGTNPITTISFIDVDEENVIETITEGVEAGGEFTITYMPSPAIETDNVYRVSVTDGNLGATSELTVRFIPRIFWGYNESSTLNSAQVLLLANSSLQTQVDNQEFGFGANPTDTIPGSTGAYVYFIYPESFPAITEVEDVSNGFVYNTTAFASSVVGYTNGFGSEIQYRVYRTTVKTFGGNFTWKIKL